MIRARAAATALVVGMLALSVCCGTMAKRRKQASSRIIIVRELKFTVQASNREPLFQVTITKEERNLTARCTCPEGGIGHVCRHRLSLLSGNRRMVVSDNADDLQLVESWVVWSDVGILIAHLADARRRFQKVKADAERSADEFDKAHEAVRTVERLLVQSIND